MSCKRFMLAVTYRRRQRPKLSDGGNEARRLQPERDGRAQRVVGRFHVWILQSKPAGAAARTEVLLVGAHGDRRFVIGARRAFGIGEKVHIHTADPPVFFQPIDMHYERWLEWALFSERRWTGPQYPNFDELMAERDRMF